jgi:hypothetical protein
MVAALTILAGIALLVSGACLAIFFATGSDPWGRANDATVAAWALLMIPSALELSSRYAGRSWAVVLVTALAVAGDLVIASTSGATAAGALDWKRSAAIGAVGLAAFAVWMGAVSAMAFLWGGLPEPLAWFGALALALAVAAALLGVRFARNAGASETRSPPRSTTAVWIAAFLCLPTWCIWLGISLPGGG